MRELAALRVAQQNTAIPRSRAAVIEDLPIPLKTKAEYFSFRQQLLDDSELKKNVSTYLTSLQSIIITGYPLNPSPGQGGLTTPPLEVFEK